MKAVIHKWQLGEVAPCGVDYSTVKVVNKGAVAKTMAVSYRWKKVDCKRCLKARKK